MKKLLLIIVIIFLTACMSDKNEINKLIVDSNNNKVEEYVDLNPIIISMYADNSVGITQKADETFTANWIAKRDIIVLSSFLTDEEYVSGKYYQDIWHKYADNYETNYKVGWELKFNYNDVSVYRVIKSPSDVADFYDYLEIYLYDSVNQTPGVWYSHLLPEEMNDNTILTTMKLTCGSKCSEITSDIEVKVYTYDTEDDFDSNGFYRGNSYDFIKVIKE